VESGSSRLGDKKSQSDAAEDECGLNQELHIPTTKTAPGTIKREARCYSPTRRRYRRTTAMRDTHSRKRKVILIPRGHCRTWENRSPKKVGGSKIQEKMVKAGRLGGGDTQGKNR